MAFSVTSTTFALVFACILVCSTLPSPVRGKPASSKSLEITEKELKRSQKSDQKSSLDDHSLESNSVLNNLEPTTETPPDGRQKNKKSDSIKPSKQSVEGTTEKFEKNIKSAEIVASSENKDQETKPKVQKKKAESVETSPGETGSESQEFTDSREYGWDSLYQRAGEERSTSSKSRGRAAAAAAAEKGTKHDADELNAEDNDAASKKIKSPAMVSKFTLDTLLTGDEQVEPLPSAERQKGKLPATTLPPATTADGDRSPTALPNGGSSTLRYVSPGLALTGVRLIVTLYKECFCSS